jgi:hypothetical protein
MLSSRKGKFVPLRKNPKLFFLSWERVMVPTNITYDDKLLKVNITTCRKGIFLKTNIRFYTEDSKGVTQVYNGKQCLYVKSYVTEDKNKDINYN